MLRQAAERTGDVVGDGTSTSTILAHAIFADGLRNVVAGASAIDIKRGSRSGRQDAPSRRLKALSRPVSTRKEKAQVAAISAHNDEAIGELVAAAMEKVGGEGVITVEESKTTETVLDVVEGMQFDRGYPVALLHHQCREDGGRARRCPSSCCATERSARSRT